MYWSTPFPLAGTSIHAAEVQPGEVHPLLSLELVNPLEEPGSSPIRSSVRALGLGSLTDREVRVCHSAKRFAHRKGRALGLTQYEPKPAGRRPDAHACF